MKRSKVLQHCLAEPGKKFRVKDHKTHWTGPDELHGLKGDQLEDQARAYVQERLGELAKAQEKLYANDVWSVLIVLQAMDAAGKDGMIKHVMSGLNPQGCQVFSFKQPSPEELDHNFLWRYAKGLPERGRIGIFNRSYYEETLVVRVHPELLDRQRLPPGKRGEKFWAQRFADINHFEEHLARNGTLVLKFFLNISKEEQKQRFLERLKNPAKNWKFSAADLLEREHWDEYMHAFEETIGATSQECAPWYVIPADHKWIARAIVSAIITERIEELDLESPKPTTEQRAALAKALKQLEKE